MRVDTRFTATPIQGAATRRTGAAAFSLGANETVQTASGSAPAAPLAGLDAILTLQAEDDSPQQRRRRSAARGQDILDGLDRLKVALLGGRVATAELATIARRLGERADASGDPRLDALIAEIELRAAVELAKLEAARTDRV